MRVWREGDHVAESRTGSWQRVVCLSVLAFLFGLLPVRLLANSGEPLTVPPLTLGDHVGSLASHLTRGLKRIAPTSPMATWQPGFSIPEQLRHKISYQYPLDLVDQYRISPDYCPGFLPEQEPEKTVDQFCHDDLLNNWQLFQGLTTNPFDVAEEQIERLNQDPTERRHRLAILAAYVGLHEGYPDVWSGAVDVLDSEQRYGLNDVLVSALGPPLLKIIPKTLTNVVTGDNEVAIDMRVTIGYSYDSVATAEQTLVTAAKRGLGAIVIAGRGQLGDALVAQRTAAKLKREGRLPPKFRVIVGEYIQTRAGAVVGIFLKSRVLEGMTLTETVKEIHHQGGLAYMARPGDIGAAASLRRLPFDGYLIQAGNFELFRTLQLLNDPRLANKPALYASNSLFSFGVGLPYSDVVLDPTKPDPLRAGLAEHNAYAAGPLFLPWMFILLSKPVALYQTTLNRFFQFNDELAIRTGRLIGANNLIFRTTWDDEIKQLISLSDALPAIRDFTSGDSPLRHTPRLSYIEAEYNSISIAYDNSSGQWWVYSRMRW